MITWTAIVPIRSLTDGKTRLTGYPGASVLTEAFARDVITACAQCPAIDRTILVSPDPAVLDLAAQLGCIGVAQEGEGGINPAIAQVRAQVPDAMNVVAILGDLPCLDATTLLDVVSTAAEYETSFVPDTAGTGTTIWCTRDPSAESHFGHHSRAHHHASGAIELGGAQASAEWARARRDVDTDIDLWDAQRLGVGPATRALVQPATYQAN